MKIVDVREVMVPIPSTMRNAVIDFSEMTVSLVAVISDQIVDHRPVVGFGFNSNGRYAQSGILRQRLFPRLLAAEADALLDNNRSIFDPKKIQAVLMQNEKPGGHGDRAVAIGILDMAIWDLVSKIERKPLRQTIADRLGIAPPLDTVAVYAAGGYYAPGKGVAKLCAEIQRYVDLGYTTVKIKIGGAPLSEDRQRIEAVLNSLPPGYRLAVDANGRLSVRESLQYAVALEDYDLVWFEEPCDPLDFLGLAALAESYSGPLATGENLLSVPDVRNLARYGGLRQSKDILQMDPALSYGLTSYLDMLSLLKDHGWSFAQCFPHGGHQFNLEIAAALRLGGVEAYPGVFEPFGGFGDDQPIVQGHIRVLDAPGIGIEHKAALRPLLSNLMEGMAST